MISLLVIVSSACTGPKAQDARTSSAPSPAASATPSPAAASDIRFLLDATYLVGDHAIVRIENVGDVTYQYQFTYEACFLSYFDSQGREFIIPPGTHCDMLSDAPIKPGETKRLFEWDLDECVKDAWGCQKSRPLEPGVYMIRGSFKPVGDGLPARAEAIFEIQQYGR